MRKFLLVLIVLALLLCLDQPARAQEVYSVYLPFTSSANGVWVCGPFLEGLPGDTVAQGVKCTWKFY